MSTRLFWGGFSSVEFASLFTEALLFLVVTTGCCRGWVGDEVEGGCLHANVISPANTQNTFHNTSRNGKSDLSIYTNGGQHQDWPKKTAICNFSLTEQENRKRHNSIIFSRASKRALQPWLTNWLTNSLIHGFSKHFIPSVSLDWHGQFDSHSIHSFDEIWSDF